MLMQNSSSEYMALLKIGRGITENSNGLSEIRFAVLADHASQQLSFVLKATLLEQGFFPNVYEGDYSTAALDAYNKNSELYAFKPEYILFSLAVQKYRDRFLSDTDPHFRENLPKSYAQEALGIIDVLTEAGFRVIVSNFALPSERMFGNFSILTPQSLYGSVLRFNALLAEAVAKRRGCQLNDVMYIANRIGSDAFFDERLWSSAKYICATRYLPEITRSIVRIALVNKGKVRKCLVLDLDNTLWGGVIGDDGKEGILLGGDAVGESYQLFQKYLLSLKHRGFVLAVCSKNNEEIALDAFRNHQEMILREEDIAVFVANWNDKASNIEYITRVLNLGLDSFIFIDDSSFERNLVKTALPTVAVPEMPEDVSEYIQAIEASGVLESSGYSKEDYTRNQKYREEAQRATEEIKYNSIDDYLQSLDMKIDIGPFTSDSLPRIAQLLQRSNQFNLCTRRFSESDCEQFRCEPDKYVTVQARLQDRFGEYGLIAVICGKIMEQRLHVAEFVMSCRVLRRGVEEHLMNHLFSQCAKHGLKGVIGEYIKTPKNMMVKDLYKNFGFSQTKDEGNRQEWYQDFDSYKPHAIFIQEI
jgi:FkbH-like protein